MCLTGVVDTKPMEPVRPVHSDRTTSNCAHTSLQFGRGMGPRIPMVAGPKGFPRYGGAEAGPTYFAAAYAHQDYRV